MSAFRRHLSLLAAIVCAALLVVGVQVTAQEDSARQLTLAHTSSFYNHIEEFKPFGQPVQGGAARLATAIRAIRDEHPNTLLLSSGRDVMGTPMFAQYGGIASAEIMSRLGYDAALATDVDLGAGGSIEGFQVYNAVAAFPILSANLDLSNLGDLNVLPYMIFDLNGTRVGVIGLSSEGGGVLTNLGESIVASDILETIEQSLAELNAQGIDIIVMLSALGVSRNAEIAQLHGGPQGIDVILGNDSSVVLGDEAEMAALNLRPLGPYPLVFNADTTPTLVTYAGKFGSFLGHLDLTFDAAGVLQSWDGGLQFMGEHIMPDPEMQAFVDELAAGIQLDQIVIGEATTDLTGAFRDYSWTENPLTNLYADAFLEAGQPFGAEAALVNAGAVWDTINAGTITLADLMRAQPFFNWLIVSEITGDQLLAMLEHGLEFYGSPSSDQSGRFLHVAGIHYSFDPTLPVGQRVLEASVNGAPVERGATYTVAVNDFMANGGDGFTMLQDARTRFNTGLSITELLQQHIEANSPLTMPAMGRMTAR